MEAAKADKADAEQEKLELERKRFELEEMKFAHAKTMDEKKLKSERSTKLWRKFSIFTPLIILLVGVFLISYGERLKREQVLKLETVKGQRQFVAKQMAEFDYPTQFRLIKGGGVFDS